MEEIREFLAAPQIADIIAYFLLLVLFIMQAFIKKFVRKDNTSTLLKIDTKTDKLKSLQAELDTERKRYEEDRHLWGQKVADMENELSLVKQVIVTGFGSVESLVKSGAANTLAKTLKGEIKDKEN